MSKYKKGIGYYSPKLYQFTLQNGQVTEVFEMKHGYLKPKWIKPYESYTVQADGSIVKTENKGWKQEVTVFADTNGDGWYEKISESYTWNGNPTGTLPTSAWSMGPYVGSRKTFTFDAQGQLVEVQEVKNGWLKPESPWKYASAQTQGDMVVLNQYNGKWEVYRDTNGDGVYTEVAQGFGAVVDLSGIAQQTQGWVL